MGMLAPTSFTSYTLTEQELLEGAILNVAQKQVIHTERALIAEQILTLAYDPAKPLEFVQQDSYLKGQLSIYSTLLERSEEAESALRALIQSTTR